MNPFRLLFLCTLFLASYSNAQRIAMVDLKVHPDTLVEKFKAKGLKPLNALEKYTLVGNLQGEKVRMKIDLTPMSQQVYQVTVTYANHPMIWDSIKCSFCNRLAKLEERYSSSKNKDIVFPEGYSDGSGNELKGIAENKVHYAINWGDMPFFQNLFLQMQVNAKGEIEVLYRLRDNFMKFEEEQQMKGNELRF